MLKASAVKDQPLSMLLRSSVDPATAFGLKVKLRVKDYGILQVVVGLTNLHNSKLCCTFLCCTLQNYFVHYCCTNVIFCMNICWLLPLKISMTPVQNGKYSIHAHPSIHV